VFENKEELMIGKAYHELNVGDCAEFSKTIGESDIYLYAGLTGDFNPAHVNEIYSNKTFFKTRIAHGMLSAGLISTVIGTLLPGPGSIYLKQELYFLTPVHMGDTITAKVEVMEKIKKNKRVRLQTHCYNQDGINVLEGYAVVSPPRVLKK
jgi:3-hydroxybutyryl-CoA dehydratase